MTLVSFPIACKLSRVRALASRASVFLSADLLCFNLRRLRVAL